MQRRFCFELNKENYVHFTNIYIYILEGKKEDTCR